MFISRIRNQFGQQYRFIHMGTEELPEVIATFDLDIEEFDVQMPVDFEELENGLYINVEGDVYDIDGDYDYD